MAKKLMLGNEAVARGLWEAGMTFASSYPGTPSTEITEFCARYPEMNCQWAPNEKVAVETSFGACMVAGVGTGIWKDLEEACRLVKVETETWPVKENQAAYRDAFEIYSKIYPALKPVYDLSASKGY